MNDDKINELLKRYRENECMERTGPNLDAGEINEVLLALGLPSFAKNITAPDANDGTLVFPVLLFMILSLADKINKISQDKS